MKARCCSSSAGTLTLRDESHGMYGIEPSLAGVMRHAVAPGK